MSDNTKPQAEIIQQVQEVKNESTEIKANDNTQISNHQPTEKRDLQNDLPNDFNLAGQKKSDAHETKAKTIDRKDILKNRENLMKAFSNISELIKETSTNINKSNNEIIEAMASNSLKQPEINQTLENTVEQKDIFGNVSNIMPPNDANEQESMKYDFENRDINAVFSAGEIRDAFDPKDINENIKDSNFLIDHDDRQHVENEGSPLEQPRENYIQDELQINKMEKPIKESSKIQKTKKVAASHENKNLADREVRQSRLVDIKKMKEEIENQLKTLNNQLDEIHEVADIGGETSTLQKKRQPNNLQPLKNLEIEEIKLKNMGINSSKSKLIKPKEDEVFDKNLDEEYNLLQKKRLEIKEKISMGKKKKKILNDLDVFDIDKNKFDPISVKNEPEPLYKRMEKKFQEEIVLPEIENRKKILTEHKQIYKPFKDNELVEYEHQHMDDHKKKNLFKQAERYESNKLLSIPSHHYRSPIWRVVKETDEDYRSKKNKQALERKLLFDRQNQYGKLVKEMFFPKIAQMKQSTSKEDFQEKIDPLENTAKYSTTMPSNNKNNLKKEKANIESSNAANVRQDEKPGRIIRQNIPKVSKKLQVETDADAIISKEEINERKNINLSPQGSVASKAQIIKKKSPPPVPIEESPPRIVYHDYLKDIRKERNEKGVKPKHKEWEKHLVDSNLSPGQKIAVILDDIDRMEKGAERRQRRITKDIAKDPRTIEEEEAVNDMYVQSIRAKLALLNGIN